MKITLAEQGLFVLRLVGDSDRSGREHRFRAAPLRGVKSKKY
jgi:hypothetical protein